MTMVDYSYIGSGKIYLSNLALTTGLLEVGNCSKLSFTTDEEIKELQDYQSPGGGVINEVRRIKGCGISMEVHQLDAANLARALYGTTSAVSGSTVTGEEVVARDDALIRLAKPNPTSVTVKGDGGTPTYVAGTDYEVRPGGLYILSAGSIAPASTIEVDYTYGGYNLVQALAAAAGEYLLFFEGLNEARSGKPVLIDAWRVRFGAAKEVSLIGDDYAVLSVEGKVLKDTTKVGGISQYFTATLMQ
jgi:hypothetical protein